MGELPREVGRLHRHHPLFAQHQPTKWDKIPELNRGDRSNAGRCKVANNGHRAQRAPISETRTGKQISWWVGVLGFPVATASLLYGVLSYRGDEADRAEARRTSAQSTPVTHDEDRPRSVSISSPKPSIKSVKRAAPPTPASLRQEVPARFIGTWFGQVAQFGSQNYTLKLRIKGGELGKSVATAEYKELGCSGYDELSKVVSGNELKLREVITVGVEKCIEEMAVELRYDWTGSLSYSSRAASGEWSTATLTKVAD